MAGAVQDQDLRTFITTLLGRIKACSKWMRLPAAVDLSGSITADGAWHELDLTTQTSAKAKRVYLMVEVSKAINDGANYFLRIHTRMEGSTESFEGAVGEEHTNNSGGAHTYNVRGNIMQDVDGAQVLEYQVFGAIQQFLLIGFWE